MSIKTVLYAEDEDNDVFIMRRTFRKLELPHALHVVTDGAQARDYIAGIGPFADRSLHPFPDLVILDLKMPCLSGLDVLRWARANGPFKELPIVLWTSSNQERDIQAALHEGANGFLIKPSSLEQWGHTLSVVEKSFLADGPRPTWLQLEEGEPSPSRSDVHRH